MFRRIAIIGVGLIGGSLGLAWKQRRIQAEIIGFDTAPGSLRRAAEIGAIDHGAGSLEEAVCSSDLVVLATPVGATLDLAERLAPILMKGAVVTDVGSTKTAICRRMAAALPSPPEAVFIGGHPMAGSEGQGIEAADPYLFQNAIYVLTPPALVSSDGRLGETAASRFLDEAFEGLKRLIEATGAKVAVMEPERHDRWVAAVSHLPQLVAVALVNAVAEADRQDPGLLSLAAGGFRDTTRITASPPGIWLDILASNSGPVLEMLGRFRHVLLVIEEAVRAGDLETIRREFERAREVRKHVPRKPKGLLPAYHEVVVTVEDRPGVIGRIAGLLGDNGVNIEDIEILRLREGEGGTIRLGFATEEECGRAFAVLAAAGIKVQRR